MSLFILTFINILCTVIYVAVLARVLSSWFNIGPSSPFFVVLRVIYALTEPILGPIRKMLPKTAMFDFSPIVAILLIQVVRWVFRSIM